MSFLGNCRAFIFVIMISHSTLGNNGRLGNGLFQIASTIGISASNGTEAIFPPWKYEKYFANPLPHGPQGGQKLGETGFHYKPVKIDRSKNYDLWGYFQSEKYFDKVRDQVKKQFEFKTEFKRSVAGKLTALLPTFFSDKVIPVAVSVRRGDYVGNPNYACLNKHYYNEGLSIVSAHIPKNCEMQVVVFSDDLTWCRQNLTEYGNIIFTDTMDAVEQLCALSMCTHFVTANSTYSWWGAWLGEKEGSVIIAPEKWFGTGLSHLSDKDIIPERWTRIPCTDENKKAGALIDLKDVTFTIPVKYDHPDREENLKLVIAYLRRHFDTSIIVMESGDTPMLSQCGEYAEYYFYRKQSYMHRTAMLNHMARLSRTPIIFNWDTDILIDVQQIKNCVIQLRTGADMCYPYDGRFFRIDRANYSTLYETLDLKCVGNHQPSKHEKEIKSFGGAVGYRKSSFVAGGMENEGFISYGPEDYERYERFTRLGFKVKRVNGPLYHINHYTGPDSSPNNPFFKGNHEQYESIKKMNRKELEALVKSWGWV